MIAKLFTPVYTFQIPEDWKGTFDLNGQNISVLGDLGTCTDTDWVSATDATLSDVQLIIINQVKQLAGEKIVALYPEWKQRNMIARSAELIRKEANGSIIAAETTELTTLETNWNDISAIRAASDSMEIELLALLTVTDVIDYDIATNILWP